MLPYASYLRVYEPIEALDHSVQATLPAHARNASATNVVLDAEQRTALARIVTSTALTLEPRGHPGAYVLSRAGRTYFCPVDLPLRSWLSLTALINSIGDAATTLMFPPESLATASEDFLRWRRDHPEAVAHIRQSTWGVPRTWFVMVVEDEREVYDAGGKLSVRYRGRVADARHRLAAAHRTLSAVIGDDELLDELLDLSSWLQSFDDTSWVELDYAGLAGLMADQLSTDQSAREVHRAIESLRRGDYSSAGSAYRSFEQRWRPIRAFERAN